MVTLEGLRQIQHLQGLQGLRAVVFHVVVQRKKLRKVTNNLKSVDRKRLTDFFMKCLC